MSCTGFTNLGVSGNCTPGYNNGVVLFEEAQSIDIESAGLKDTYDTLADAQPPDNLNFIKFFQIEEAANETVFEEGLAGEQVVVDLKIPTSKYHIIADESALNGIYNELKSGVIAYGFFTTNKGAIIGKLSSDKTKIETIKMYIATTHDNDAPDKLGKVTLNIRPREDYKGNMHAVALEFSFDDLEIVKSMFATEAAGTSTDKAITLKLWDNGYIPNLDGTDSGFIVKDSTGATVAHTGTTVVGNEYTIAFSALTAGDYTVEYWKSGDYMYLAPITVTVTA